MTDRSFLGDPEAVVDEQGWLPSERREGFLAEFAAEFNAEAGDLHQRLPILRAASAIFSSRHMLEMLLAHELARRRCHVLPDYWGNPEPPLSSVARVERVDQDRTCPPRGDATAQRRTASIGASAARGHTCRSID
jgi:hypothetical protein